MASRPGPSPLTDQQIQSAVSRLVNFYVRNRKTISRAGWLILLVSLGNRVRVAVNDQKKPRPTPPTQTTIPTTTKKRKAEVNTPLQMYKLIGRLIERSLIDYESWLKLSFRG